MNAASAAIANHLNIAEALIVAVQQSAQTQEWCFGAADEESF